MSPVHPPPMRRAVSLWLVAWLSTGIGTHPVLAATFYVNATTGEDSHSAEEAQDPSKPWKSLSRAMKSSLAPGDMVHVAAGTYDTNNGEIFPIPLKDGVAIMGEGASATSIQAPGSATSVFEGTGGLGEGTWLEGLQLTTDATNTNTITRGVELLTQADQSLTISDVTFGPNMNQGVAQRYETESPAHLTLDISESRFDDLSSYGIRALNSSYSLQPFFDLSLTNSTFTQTEYGVSVTLSGASSLMSANVDMTGNSFTDAYEGLYFYGADLKSGANVGLTIQNNTFTTVNYPIDVTFSSQTMSDGDVHRVDLLIDQNQFSGSREALYWGEGSSSGGDYQRAITLSGNTIQDSDYDGFYLSGYSFANARLEETIKIENNQLTRAGSYAVFFGQYDHYAVDLDIDITVDGNTFTDNDRAVYASFSSFNSGNTDQSLAITNNTVDTTAYSALQLDLYELNNGTAAIQYLINNNTITNVGGTGIDFSFTDVSSVIGTFHSEVKDNTLSSIGNSGVYDYQSETNNSTLVMDTLIAGNTITDTGSDGVYVSYSSLSNVIGTYDITVLENSISDTAGNGIQLIQYGYRNGLADVGITMAGNTVTNSGSAGLEASMTIASSSEELKYHTQVLNNHVVSPNSTGISVNANSSSGLGETSALAINISGNQITSPKKTGIDYQVNGWLTGESDITLGGNTITNGSGAGLHMAMSSMNALSRNVGRVMDNQIHGNALVGAALDLYSYVGPYMLMSGNSITDNGGYGLYLSMYSFAANEVAVDVGGGPLQSAGLNVLTGNDSSTGFQLYYDGGVDGSASGALYAARNYWGSLPEGDIDAVVFDDEERCAVGRQSNADFVSARAGASASAVTVCGDETSPFHTYLNEPQTIAPSTNADATLTATVAEDGGLTGASPGDTLHMTATLNGTGQVGCREALFRSQIPDGAALVPGSLTTSKGTLLHANAKEVLVALGWLAAGESIQVEWELAADSTGSCTPITLQGTLSCAQLGSVPTDDPNSAPNGDATTIAFATSTFYADADGDGQGDLNSVKSTCYPGTPEGYVDNSTDCNDDNNAIYSGAPETCNGVDEDCDGTVDNGVSLTFYPDSDNDSHGAMEGAQQACSAPEGFVASSDDCNDSNGSIYPGATELCDGVDNDCNESIDDGVTTTLYLDGDGDGFGSDTTITGCAGTEGYATQGGDCNDDESTINPDATEICDELDNDCDGRTDEALFVTVYTDSDHDGFGNPEEQHELCNPDLNDYSSNGDDCNDADGAINPDATEVCDSVDNNCDGQTDEGVKSVFYADGDGDGYGNAADSVEACAAPTGYVSDKTDCADTDGAIHPTAAEACDSVDNDCNGAVDDAEACDTSGIIVTGSGCACDTKHTGAPSPVGGAAGVFALAWLALRRRRQQHP